MQQAEALLGFAETDLAPLDPDILFVGDYNAYGAEPDCRPDGWRAGEPRWRRFVPEADQYVFDGAGTWIMRRQHCIRHLPRSRVAGFWHINADEPSVIDYTDWKTATCRTS